MTEDIAILQAKIAGYYVRSGRPLAWLAGWKTWCAQSGRKCIVVIQGSKQAVVEVDGIPVLKLKPGEAEAAAARLAEEDRGLF